MLLEAFHKSITQRHKFTMFSFLDDEIVAILNIIKEDVDAKVYDRNDILKKDNGYNLIIKE